MRAILPRAAGWLSGWRNAVREDLWDHERRIEALEPKGGIPKVDRSPFSGNVKIANLPGFKVDVNAADYNGKEPTRYLLIYLFQHTPQWEWVDAMPDTDASDSVVYDLLETYGAIKLVGQFAG